jgi:hypothetical protein
VPGENDDVPPRARGAVRPPPSLSPEDAPDSVAVPRMEPLPPSLEAMVDNRGRPTRPKPPEAKTPPVQAWVVVAVTLVLAVLTAFLMR